MFMVEPHGMFHHFFFSSTSAMPNYFNDNSDLLHHFSRLDLRDAVRVLERDYQEAARYDFAPHTYEEAIALYRGALELVGDLSGNFIAPRAHSVDEEGASLHGGKVSYAAGTREALDKLADAGLMGVILPRQYGGVNFPATIYIMMIEMVSRADASLMTLFGYQDVGETIARLGTPEQKQEFLPLYASGEWTGATCLSEPGAGSDLQGVKLHAYQDAGGQWRLRGIKHFISNGCGQVLVVLARSEPGTNNMFGLSLFVCHGDETVQVTRIEHKMGLNGSPTCELYFNDTPAQLLGKRRFGLINVLYILNHARFSVAAQGLGIAEAAYQEALRWCRERVQFGKTLYSMPAIGNILIDMRVAIEAGRSLLYWSTQWLDLRNKLEEEIAELKTHGKAAGDLQSRFDQAARYVDLLSPLVKYRVTEAANRVVYEALQLHGGMGYMREMPVERFARDVRITSIYEGATSVQVAGALRSVMNDVMADWFDDKEKRRIPSELDDLAGMLKSLRKTFLECLEAVSTDGSPSVRDASGKDLCDMYADMITGYLLLEEAEESPRKTFIARRYIRKASAEAARSSASTRNGQFADVPHLDIICSDASASPSGSEKAE
jgi:hypothetical protein